MSSEKRRRKWSPAQKLRIVLEALQSDGKLAAICRREGLSPASRTLVSRPARASNRPRQPAGFWAP